MRRRIPGLLIVAAAFAAPLGAQTPDRATLVARIDSMANAVIAEGNAPGLSIGVVRGSDTITLKGYGLADVENRVPVTDRGVFRTGSLTKQFTSAAVMKLIEEGKVRLDAPLSQYLPDYRGPGARVTVHQLLNHTSGIPSYTGMEEFWERSRLDLTHEQMFELFADDSLDFEPGSRFSYNNSGYYLLGVLIEKVTGEGYAEHLRRTLWEPLGLTQTVYCDQETIIPHRVQGYAMEEGTLINAPPLSMNPPGAAGALCSTPRDLVRWTRALVSGRVVSPASYAAMTAPTTLGTGEVEQYGYGLAPGKLGEHAVVQHSGGINGFSAFLAYFPAEELTIAVLANGGANTGAIKDRIARAIFGMPAPAPRAAPAEVPIEAAQLERYVGTYDLAPAVPIQVRVFVENGRLIAQGTDQAPLQLRHLGNHGFAGPDGMGIRMVFTMDGDHATSMTVHQGGTELVARRIE